METLIARVRANLERFAPRRLSVPLEGRKPAAVALALIRGEAGEPSFVLTRRAAKLRRHAGQWALPGGRLDAGETPERGALREMREEVGLDLGEQSVLGRLDDYPTRSGFVITPIVVWSGERAALKPDPKEVAAIYRVPVAELGRPGVPHLRSIPESDRPVISIPLLDTHIHAPTAAILYQLHEVALSGRATRVDHYEQPLFAWR
jgi:mutator protein MutT